MRRNDSANPLLAEDLTRSTNDETYPPVPRVRDGAHISSLEQYYTMYRESITSPDKFWDKLGKELVSWFEPFQLAHDGGFEYGDVVWYVGGKLNVAFNCLDRHIPTRGDKVAILWEGDDPAETQRITYRELLRDVCRMSNVLLSAGVKKGDRVCIYLPMIPMAAIAMLACARIGAVHSVVFAGFSATALRDRINDAQARVLVTSNEGMRGGKAVPLKKMVDEALLGCPGVQRVYVWNRTSNVPTMTPERDVNLNDALQQARPYCPPVSVDAEDTLFLLYTSGSTGKPKGLAHTTGGYLVYAAATHKYIFDYRENDIYACVADIGWITGHTYVVYGPLANGATTVMFEGLPTVPTASRYWEMVEKYKINSFYTSPTAIRTLMAQGEEPVKKHDRSTLRVLGSVGEPINPEAWKWYHRVVGNEECAIVDTYWQTETGGIIITPLPGVTPTKPGSATFPFFGIDAVILDATNGKVLTENEVSGLLAVRRPWPGMARTIYGDHQRYLDIYLRQAPGYYFTGDGCVRDKEGYIWITGRVDDVINKAGHRLGTAETESALVGYAGCSEAAVVAVYEFVKGQAIVAFVSLRHGYSESPTLIAELKSQVRAQIGPIAVPDMIFVTNALPKTRSGKIMRRLLRKIASGEFDLGDTSTLTNPEDFAKLADKVKLHLEKQPKQPAA